MIWQNKKKKTFIQNDEKKVKPKKISERKNSGENTKEKKPKNLDKKTNK